MYVTSTESVIGPNLIELEFIYYDLSKFCIRTEEEIIGMLDEISDAFDNEPVEEADNV